MYRMFNVMKMINGLKQSKFGLKSIINIFYFIDFIWDMNVSIINKGKVIISFLVAIVYGLLSIDLIPEMLVGGLGYIDDVIIIIISLSILSNEIDEYKKNIRNNKNKKQSKKEKIIDFAKFDVKD